MKGIIGYTGFVGSTLYHQYGHKFFDKVYNSKNIHEIDGVHFNYLICAGVPANKWWANTHPKEDLENINALLNHVRKITCDELILISTIDVYNINLKDIQNEDILIEGDNHAYGVNRLYFEKQIRNLFPNLKIVRLPALFGLGLKKNILFDLIHDNQVNKINVNSSYQWYPMNRLMDDIENVRCMDKTIHNFFPEPIETTRITNLFNYTYMVGDRVSYDIREMNNDYFLSSDYVFSEIKRFINLMTKNNIVISNLGLKTIPSIDFISALEIAPYKFNGNESFFNQKFIQKCRDYNIYSMQAWLYPQNINMHTQTQEFIEYCKTTIDYAHEIGSKILVFGSPKNRYTNNYTVDYAKSIHTFREIGDYAHSKSIIFCIEPNSTKYNCNFITNSTEGREIVLKVNSPGFGLHLDVGNMFMENEDILHNIVLNIDILRHVHFSAPYLKSLRNSEINYKKIYDYLIDMNYDGKIGLEYLECDDTLEEILYDLF